MTDTNNDPAANFDDEMKDLLDQLDDDGQETMGEMSSDALRSDVSESDAPASTIRPADRHELIQPDEVPTDPIMASVTELSLSDLKKRFDQLEAVTEEVLQAARSDRQETQDAINLMRSEIDKAVRAGSNPPRMYVDNLVKALEVKANINMTVVKIMEANSKFLAATRIGTVIQTNLQVNQSTDSHDLENLLSEPLTETDEY